MVHVKEVGEYPGQGFRVVVIVEKVLMGRGIGGVVSLFGFEQKLGEGVSGGTQQWTGSN